MVFMVIFDNVVFVESTLLQTSCELCPFQAGQWPDHALFKNSDEPKSRSHKNTFGVYTCTSAVLTYTMKVKLSNAPCAVDQNSSEWQVVRCLPVLVCGTHCQLCSICWTHIRLTEAARRSDVFLLGIVYKIPYFLPYLFTHLKESESIPLRLREDRIPFRLSIKTVHSHFVQYQVDSRLIRDTEKKSVRANIAEIRRPLDSEPVVKYLLVSWIGDDKSLRDGAFRCDQRQADRKDDGI